MLFNTYSFIFIFLPITYLGFIWLLPRNQALVWLTAASLMFYILWNPAHLIILLASILFNYILGVFIIRAKTHGQDLVSGNFLVLGIAFNLLLLSNFKYLRAEMPAANFLALESPEAFILPVGISFFTFTQLAYLIDAGRGQIPKPAPFLDYVLFVSYFPHLVAGPVLNHRNILPQFHRISPDVLRLENLMGGLSIFSVGLFKKTILADHLAPLADTIFQKIAAANPVHFLDAWFGALAYTFQLYYDFSGYSDMAIGLSLLFGIRLPANFNAPYRATSLIDFWRRWHMTLSHFLLNYLYIPLGGNRKGFFRCSFNLFITMVLGGLWHGFGLTYLFWGIFHGFLLVLNHAFRTFSYRFAPLIFFPLFIRKGCKWLFTFSMVVIGWVIFRSPDILTTGRYFAALINLKAETSASMDPLSMIWIVVAIGIALLAPTTQRFFCILQPVLANKENDFSPSWLTWQPSFLWAIAIGLLSAAAVLGIGKISPFLYYQF